MKHTLRALIVLIAFALLGAPFGMARMMGGHEVRAETHQQHQTPQKSAQHATIIVCAACIGVTALPEAMPERPPSIMTTALGEFSAPEGLHAIPLLPPPRG